ncbi:MAG: sigma-54-dependent Fis family transcriptional regulator [Gemmatimonadales bacterium]|nr:MAG: sigma-54-dependent Fis family transcriptional regulator [Gemmatimonadales bacterium]
MGPGHRPVERGHRRAGAGLGARARAGRPLGLRLPGPGGHGPPRPRRRAPGRGAGPGGGAIGGDGRGRPLGSLGPGPLGDGPGRAGHQHPPGSALGLGLGIGGAPPFSCLLPAAGPPRGPRRGGLGSRGPAERRRPGHRRCRRGPPPCGPLPARTHGADHHLLRRAVLHHGPPPRGLGSADPAWHPGAPPPHPRPLPSHRHRGPRRGPRPRDPVSSGQGTDYGFACHRRRTDPPPAAALPGALPLNHSILLVDDDAQVLSSLERALRARGLQVLTELRGRDAIQRWEAERPDAVVLDLKLPDVEHLEVLEELRARNAPVLLLTGHGDIQTAVEAMQLGAETFLTKPVEVEHLAAILGQVFEKNRLLAENERLARGGMRVDGLEALGVSGRMKEIARSVQVLARSERTTVLITGESGTGKGWVARLLHDLSPRSRRPFVDVNSAGLTSTFLASELFGHEKGAFTDAHTRREGLFKAADGGTLFLDEVGDLGPEIQPRLLQVLETRRFRRLGGTGELEVDVRFLAATNHDLAARVRDGQFREDLYYRLNVVVIDLPPLRERSPDDRLHLLHSLTDQLRQEIPGSADRIGDEALDLLLNHPWPGNIREMRNALERALIFASESSQVRPNHLPAEIRTPATGSRRGRFQPVALEEVEARHIERVLVHHRGNRSQTARDLGIARTTLLSKIRKYGLDL